MADFDPNPRGGLTVNRDSLHASTEYRRQVSALKQMEESDMAEKMTLEQVRDFHRAQSKVYGSWAEQRMHARTADAIDAHLAQPAQQNCFCDRMYPDSDPGASCGDCPTRDYKAIQPAPAVDVGAIREVIDDLREWGETDAQLAARAVTLTRAIGNAQAEAALDWNSESTKPSDDPMNASNGE